MIIRNSTRGRMHTLYYQMYSGYLLKLRSEKHNISIEGDNLEMIDFALAILNNQPSLTLCEDDGVRELAERVTDYVRREEEEEHAEPSVDQDA